MVQIRHAEPADAAQWLSLRIALWPDEASAALAGDVARFFAEPRVGPGVMPEAVLVAEDPGAPALGLVGFAELSRRLYAEGCATSPVGFLEGWYVVPPYRRQAVGRGLVTASLEWARAKGCREFASDTTFDNTLSAAAHRALGFEEVEVIRCFRRDIDP